MSFTLLGSGCSVRVQVRFRFTFMFGFAVGALLLCAPTVARAEVTRVEITSRVDLSYAGYEKIVGRVFFAVDPADARNAVVADIDKAPRSANRRVEFSADFYIVRPKTAGNGVALVDIVNRGSKTVIPNFNRVDDLDSRNPDVGDAFLMRRGFTVAAVGWEFDLPASGDVIRIAVPTAVEDGRPITGVVRTSFAPDRPDPYRLNNVAAYPAIDAAGPDSILTVRDHVAGPATIIAVIAGRWTVGRWR